MERWPTRNGIAIAPHEVWLPNGRKKKTNNHHHHYSSTQFNKSIATTALRDLARHQTMMPIDQHRWVHDNYLPPQLPTEEQAALDVIDAYDRGEQFKIYNRQCHWYDLKDIPQDLVDDFICKYSLIRVFDMAAD